MRLNLLDEGPKGFPGEDVIDGTKIAVCQYSGTRSAGPGIQNRARKPDQTRTRVGDGEERRPQITIVRAQFKKCTALVSLLRVHQCPGSGRISKILLEASKGISRRINARKKSTGSGRTQDGFQRGNCTSLSNESIISF